MAQQQQQQVAEREVLVEIEVEGGDVGQFIYHRDAHRRVAAPRPTEEDHPVGERTGQRA